MTLRTLHIRIESHSDFKSRSLAAVRRIDSGSTPVAGEHVSFADMRAYLSALSAKRMELLARLKAIGPSSIRHLSKALERDYKSVHQDVAILMEVGLIERREDGSVEAPYDRIVSDIRMVAA